MDLVDNIDPPSLLVKGSKKTKSEALKTLEEYERLHQMLHIEREAKEQGHQRICGVDEAGRGPLAGPVVASACILPDAVFKEPLLLRHLDDSKKLLPEMREQLFQVLSLLPDLFFGIGIVDHREIDALNIFQATLLAMKRAIKKLIHKPCLILVDGKHAPKQKIPVRTVVKGDQLSLSVAAASVIAKVTRDRMMEAYDERWPGYGFKKHKGYATEEHLNALERLGPSPIHRNSFAPVREAHLLSLN